jgi:hypothetical protein
VTSREFLFARDQKAGREIPETSARCRRSGRDAKYPIPGASTISDFAIDASHVAGAIFTV